MNARAPGFLLVCAVAFGPARASAAPQIRTVKLLVENPTERPRPSAPLVVPTADLVRVAPDLKPAHVIVTTTAARTLEEDAAALEATELASQVDDLDGDDRPDELAFQITLGPKEKRIVTIAFGPPGAVARLRSPYPARAHARFSRHFEGPGWESELVAFRFYFDDRRGIDVFGKRRPGLYLDELARPGFDYHAESPHVRDIYKIGPALGIGSVGFIVDGRVVRPEKPRDRSYTIIAAGPVRAIVDVRERGLSVAGKTVDLESRFVQWAGERGFDHLVTVTGAAAVTLVTGLPRKPDVERLVAKPARGFAVATWGPQVVRPGADATQALPDERLGLALVFDRPLPVSDGEHDHLVTVPADRGRARFHVLAAWQGESREPLLASAATASARLQGGTIALPSPAPLDRAAFTALVERAIADRTSPIAVRMLSTKAAPQPAPPDTWTAARRKTFAEAIALVSQHAIATATAWEPILTRSRNEDFDKKTQGQGFFTEADNKNGAWKPQKGYFWTGSFWPGLLFRLHEHTRDARFRRWAELWTSRLVGHENQQDHDAGFLNFYSSAFAYRVTGDAAYRAGALRGAERMKALWNPKTGLVTAWEDNGDDTIIDTMLNLELWWWAARETGEARWRELALGHALKSAAWLVRPDGSVSQSVHYNPGDGRQEFRSHGKVVALPNQAPPGERVFNHTHQGFAADTSWSRGVAWALYGFTRAYEETQDDRMRETAARVAAFVLDRLPEDGVPWYDFDDEGVHFRNRDSSAAALIAAALPRLAAVTPDPATATRYRSEARRILTTLVDHYLTPVGRGDTAAPGLLRHGSSLRPADSGLIYGQYYLLEALLAATREEVAAKGR